MEAGMKILAITLIALCSGCTVIRKKESDGATLFYGSWGTDKRVQSLEYGELKIKGLNVNQTKGVKSAAEGVVKGAKGF